MINDNENEVEKEKIHHIDTTQLDLDMDPNIMNMKYVSVR